MVYFQCYLSDNCRTWNCLLVGVSSKSFKYHHVPHELLRVGHNVMVHWHNPILDSHRFPYCIVNSRAFIGSRFIILRLLFLLSCFTYSLPQNPLKVKEILLIFLATPGAFIYWTINRRRDHSIQVHCYIKYVRNLKKDYEILPYNAASMDKETYTEKCNHSFDDRYIPWISVL